MSLSPWRPESYSLTRLYEAVENGLLQEIANINIVEGDKNCNIGLLCYKQFQKKRNFELCTINQESFCSFREEIIKRVLEDCVSRNLTFRAVFELKIFLHNFLVFSGNERIKDPVSLVLHYEYYSEHLRHLVRTYDPSEKHGLTARTASNKQRNSRAITRLISGAHSCDHIPIIKANSKQVQSTLAAPTEVIAEYLNHHADIFTQVASLVVEEKLEFPVPLNVSGNNYFYIPSGVLRVKLGSDPEREGRAGCIGFSFEEGRLASIEEVKYKLRKNGCPENKIVMRAGQVRSAAKACLISANNDKNDINRLRLINLALRSYFVLFLIITGMNDSVASRIKLNSISLAKGGRKLFSFKARANGRKIEVEIQSVFKDSFDKFLEFRDFIAKSEKTDVDTLFVEYNLRKKSQGKYPLIRLRDDGCAFSRATTNSDFKSLLPKMTSRQIRVSKGQWIVKKHGLEASAYVLQHSVNTNISSYNESTQEEADREITKFFSEFNKVVVASDNEEFSTITAVGGCRDLGEPSFVDGAELAFKPNCTRMEGCLFCDKYAVHADELDVRKLVSLLFIANIYKKISDSVELYEDVFRPLIDRVEEILESMVIMKPRLENIITNIRLDVFENENLSDYWMKKYEILDDLGVI